MFAIYVIISLMITLMKYFVFISMNLVECVLLFIYIMLNV